MQVVVIGGGAIGLLYAARLALSGVRVHVVTRTAQQAAALAGAGLRCRIEDEEAVAAVEASTWDTCGAELMSAQWVLLTVKQTALDAGLIGALSRLLQPDAALICLQNGIGHLGPLQEGLPHARIYAAVTSEGALREDCATVRMTGRGQLHFGPPPSWDYGGDRNVDACQAADGGRSDPRIPEQEKMLLGMLRKAGIDAFLSNDMGNRIYRKLLINAVINPLTAIFGVENGLLPEHPFRLALMNRLHKETEAVLLRAGMEPQADAWQRLLDVCRLTAPNVSSMLADARNGKLTEVDWINGGVAKLAHRLGMEAPLNEAVRIMVHALKP